MASSAYESYEEDDEVPILVALDDPLVVVAREARAATTTTTGGATTKETPPQRGRPSASSPQLLMPPPCPVTILSGFLGAGKTTLVQYILQSPDHGKRIAVIENEFGGGTNSDNNSSAMSIESMIARDGLTSDSLQEFIELPNGCICCTVKDSLVVTLENLLAKRADLDYILIECSGLANPGPIAAVFWLDDALQSRLQLDGIVTLVDARHVEQQLRETVEAAQQIAYADRILLNKIDLVGGDAAAIERRVNMIRRIHPTAAIQTTSYSAVPDLNWILNVGCFDAERVQDVMALQQSLLLPPADASGEEQHNHHHGHLHDHAGGGDEASCDVCTSSKLEHTHTAAVSTTSLLVRGTVDLDKVHQWLASILWPNQDERDAVLRARLEEGYAPTENSIHDDDTAAHSTEEEPQPQQRIFRLKGILSVRHAPDSDEMLNRTNDTHHHVDAASAIDRRRYIVQGVHDLWDIHATSSADLQWRDDDEDDERCCQLIVIGRHLEAARLQEGLDACRI
jgi:G3E family GTPase